LKKRKEFPNINRPFLTSLRKYYAMVHSDEEQGDGDSE
jgi:hypothetical protein